MSLHNVDNCYFKLRTCCVEVNLIAVLKVTHLLVSLQHVNTQYFCSEEDQNNGRKRLALNEK